MRRITAIAAGATGAAALSAAVIVGTASLSSGTASLTAGTAGTASTSTTALSTPAKLYACVATSGAMRSVGASTQCHSGEHKISWNKQGPTGPAGPSEAYSTAVNSFDLRTTAGQQIPVSSLTLPKAGSYVINAKLTATSYGTASVIMCKLTAGSDVDISLGAINGNPTIDAPMSLLLTHSFTAAGTAKLTCGHVYKQGDASLVYVKLVATRVGSLHAE